MGARGLILSLMHLVLHIYDSVSRAIHAKMDKKKILVIYYSRLVCMGKNYGLSLDYVLKALYTVFSSHTNLLPRK